MMAPISRKQHILDSLSMNSDNSNSCSLSQQDSSDHSFSHLSSSSSSLFSHSSLASDPLLLDHAHQFARVNRVILDKNSDEYRKRRERNNIAVKKSR